MAYGVENTFFHADMNLSVLSGIFPDVRINTIQFFMTFSIFSVLYDIFRFHARQLMSAFPSAIFTAGLIQFFYNRTTTCPGVPGPDVR